MPVVLIFAYWVLIALHVYSPSIWLGAFIACAPLAAMVVLLLFAARDDKEETE